MMRSYPAREARSASSRRMPLPLRAPIRVSQRLLARKLTNPLTPRLLKKVQMQGGARRAE